MKTFLHLISFFCFALCLIGQAAADESAAVLPSQRLALAPQADDVVPLYALQAVKPPLPSAAPASLSALEQLYKGRVIDTLQQYGYDLFGAPDISASSTAKTGEDGRTAPGRLPTGAVADDYTLAPGDVLEVVVSGPSYTRDSYTVTHEGQLLIDQFPPLPVAGRTLGVVRTDLQDMAAHLQNAQAHIALAAARQIDVLVAGHAKKPGRKTLTVFHTVMDALLESGGIEKTGSLRHIKLIRGGHSQSIDLYALLMNGESAADMRLRDGDKIIVPAIGPTVAIAGDVKRPGIYEILPALSGMFHHPSSKAQNISLNEALAFSGGVISSGDIRYLKLSAGDDGREVIETIRAAHAPVFTDGSILMVSKGTAKRSGQIELIGHTTRPGLHALEQNRTLSALLTDDTILGDDIYPLIGIIQRYDADKMAHIYIDFPLRLALKKDYDQRLRDGDKIILLSNTDIQSLQTDPFPDVPNEEDTLPLAPPRSSLAPERDAVITPALRDFLLERTFFIRGAVRKPGAYPLSDMTTLDMALAVAGGMALEASDSNIELTTALNGGDGQSHGGSGTRRLHIDLREDSPTNIALEAGDTVRVNQKFHKISDQSVLILGEVKHPGRYDLIAGDKVSDLLARAGGLTEQAYPDGAIFSRASERKAEETRFQSQARMIRQALATALHTAEDDKPAVSSAQVAEARALAAELEEAKGVGRITVEADPAILDAEPALDMLLETGDRLYIPRRNLSVRVSGEVLSPAALQFRDEKDPIDYIFEAGGFTYHADKERSFVLYPDGSAQPLRVSHWNHKASFIPPGSTIIVPRDPKPFDFVSSFKDVTQILSNLAITAIFIDDVRED